jgi:hypothetical protein
MAGDAPDRGCHGAFADVPRIGSGKGGVEIGFAGDYRRGGLERGEPFLRAVRAGRNWALL